jgi:5,10-methenyltetrahydrofolate synthetase
LVSPELVAWRKAQRADLLARRSAVAPEQRAQWGQSITRRLREGFPMLAHMTVGFCWPHAGEFDARFLIHELRVKGARAALPVVVRYREPLAWHAWWPGAPMKSGPLDIPVPDGTEPLVPDAILIPPVGFTAHGERLGYGGGFFDRTLAAIDPPPLKIAVAFEISRIETIHAEPHDVPMDFVVTESASYCVTDRALVAASAAQCAATAGRLAAERGLPRLARAAASS